MPELDPSHIMQVGMGFFASKTLLSAVEFGLFTALAKAEDDRRRDRRALGLNPRAVPDFPDALVALRLAGARGRRRGTRVYANTPRKRLFPRPRQRRPMSAASWRWRMPASIRFWDDLTEALRTGKPQNEMKHTGESLFDTLYEEPARLEQFMNAMTGISAGNFKVLRGEVRLLELSKPVRRRRRDGAALLHRRRRAPAYALHQLRSARGGADRQRGGSRGGPRRAGDGRRRRLLRGSRCPRRT